MPKEVERHERLAIVAAALACLKRREAMVGAVAILMTLPPKCTIDNKVPSHEQIGLFVVSYGHKADDAFMAEVVEQLKKNDEIARAPEPTRKEVLDFVCGYGVILTSKIRQRLD